MTLSERNALDYQSINDNDTYAVMISFSSESMRVSGKRLKMYLVTNSVTSWQLVK